MPAFLPYGPDHLAVLAGLAGLTVWLLVNRRRLRGGDDRWLRWALVVVLVISELSALLIALAGGYLVFPFQLCDLAIFFTAWALLSSRPLVGQVAYCWGLAGSLQAILTPDLGLGFPSYWWFQFFVSHCSVVVGVVYLAAAGRIVLTHRAVWKVWLLMNGYAVIAMGVNAVLGTNFGYLAHKPLQPSLLDYCGPWPYYILAMEGLALVSFYICYAPFAWGRRLAGRTA